MDNFLADYFFPLMGAGALLVIGLLIVIIRGNKKSGAAFSGNVSEPSFAAATPADIDAEVRMLIGYGNKMEAIRVVREKLGLDLKDAKDLVDAMEHGAPIPMEDAAPSPEAMDNVDSEVRELVSAGKLIDAIKLVREQKGLGLKEAKAYVEQL
jgi:ribosomal protein L7/L12